MTRYTVTFENTQPSPYASWTKQEMVDADYFTSAVRLARERVSALAWKPVSVAWWDDQTRRCILITAICDACDGVIFSGQDFMHSNTDGWTCGECTQAVMRGNEVNG